MVQKRLYNPHAEFVQRVCGGVEGELSNVLATGCSVEMAVCALLFGWLILGGVATPFATPSARAQGSRLSPWLVFARRTAGQDDVWALSADGERLLRLTATPGDERWPALSPDGRRLAYAARRNRNWDIYVLDLITGREERLTRDPHFDGWPSWSPDGRRLAFASTRAGDLDIFVVDLVRRRLENMTADSPAHDFDPDWSPDGQAIAIVSTRAGTHDIFLVSPATGEVTPLLTGALAFKRPRWLPSDRPPPASPSCKRRSRQRCARRPMYTGQWERIRGVGVASEVTPSP
ncbi:MAG: DPP IV N-terminal domain-containing protein [Ardenticatenia bacterium]|nr:DPP IV N-terminal domain-containing protein [Ardenticatenia bacterium]